MATRRQRERMRRTRLDFDAEVQRNLVIKETIAALEKMTKNQLIQYADDNDIEIDKRAKKEDIFEIIRNKVIE